MKNSRYQSRRDFIKNNAKKGVSFVLLWVTGCLKKDLKADKSTPTATRVTPTSTPKDEPVLVEATPTSASMKLEISADLLGNLVIICGDNVRLDGIPTSFVEKLFENWLTPGQYLEGETILGHIIGKGLVSRDYEGRTVLDTNSLSGEETCVIGFEYGEQFIGINISFKDLTRDYPIKTRFNGILEFHGQTYKFNTFYYIPQIDRGGGGSSDSGGGAGDGGDTSGGAVVGQTIGG